MYISLIGYDPQGSIFRKEAVYDQHFYTTIRGRRLSDISLTVRDLNTSEDIKNLSGMLEALAVSMD